MIWDKYLQIIQEQDEKNNTLIEYIEATITFLTIKLDRNRDNYIMLNVDPERFLISEIRPNIL